MRLGALKIPSALLVALAALAARLVYMLEMGGQPFFGIPVVDAAVYDHAARRILSHGFYPEIFYQSVFYPMWLAVSYQLFGTGPWVPKILQAVLGVVSCLLVFRLGRRAAGETVGLVAGLVCAFYLPMIFVEAELMSTGWEVFWALLLLELLLSAADRGGLVRCSALGLVSALACITRPTFVPFVLFGIAWLFWSRRTSSKPWKKSVLALVGAALLVLVPVSFLSLRLTGAFTFLPFGGGVNLYVGNHPDLCSTLTIRPGLAFNRLLHLPNDAGVSGLRAEDAWFRKQVRSWWKDDPAGCVRRLAMKAHRAVISREVPRNMDMYSAASESWLFRIGVWKVSGFGFPFGVLFPLAVVGCWFGRRLPLPLLAFPWIYLAAVVLVFPSSRYRIPVIPVLAVLAVVGVGGLVGLVRRRAWGGLAACGTLIVCFAVATSFPARLCEEQGGFSSELDYQVGIELLKRKMPGPAGEFLFSALRKNPRNGDAHFVLGNILVQRGDVSAATRHYEEAVEYLPGIPEPLEALAVLKLEEGELHEGKDLLEKSLQISPNSISARQNLGIALIRLGHRRKAEAHLSYVLEQEPDNVGVLQMLAWLSATDPLAGSDRLQVAEERVQKALQAGGQANPLVLQTAAAVAAAQSRFPLAIEYTRQALSITSRSKSSAAFTKELERDLERFRRGERILE